MTVPDERTAAAEDLVRGPASTRQRVLLSAGMGLLVVAAYLPGSGRAFDFDSSQTIGSYVRTPSLLDPLRSQRLFNNHPAFSLIEHVIYTLTGSAEEWVLRLAPITFAGCAVAVLVAVLHRHLGALPAACGGLFLASNPAVIDLSRAARGYSLLLLCGVISSMALARMLSADDGELTHSRAWSVLYVAAVAVGVATHLYMLPIVVGHVVVVTVRRQLGEAWVWRWMMGMGLGACVYAAMASDMEAAARVGPRTFKPAFPRQLAEMVVGSGWAAVLLGVVVAVGGIAILGRRRDLALAGLVVGAAVAVTWLGTASVHLEARFHVWLVPAAAALVAVGVRRLPALGLLVLAGAVLNVGTVVHGYLDDPNTEPELAALLDHAASRGERGCVTSFSVLPMLGYTSSFRVITSPRQLADCDVVAVPFPNLDGDLAKVARTEMGVEVTYAAYSEDGLAFARDPDYFKRLCAEGPPDLCPP